MVMNCYEFCGLDQEDAFRLEYREERYLILRSLVMSKRLVTTAEKKHRYINEHNSVWGNSFQCPSSTHLPYMPKFPTFVRTGSTQQCRLPTADWFSLDCSALCEQPDPVHWVTFHA